MIAPTPVDRIAKVLTNAGYVRLFYSIGDSRPKV